MSRYRLRDFTPVPDELVKKYGATTSLVYGRVWRFANGGLRDCTASIGTIAKELGLSVNTVRKSLAILIGKKEIIDKTPDLKNAPHILNITRQLSLTLSIKMEDAVQNLHSGYAKIAHKDTIKENIKDKDSAKAHAKPSNNKSQPASIKVFREKAHRFPAKSWWGLIDETVGEVEKDLEMWGEIVFNWVGLGWNPTNAAGMLEFYQRREIPSMQHKYNEPKQKSVQSAREFLDELERTAN